MLRKLTLVFLLALSLILLFAKEVNAASSVDVTITWNPGGLFAPTNFVATYINDHKITLSWTPNPLAVATMVRAKVGSYPTGTADGLLVYSGAGVTIDDTSVSLDETASQIYYRAWSVDGGGGFSPNYAQDNTGGKGMTLIAFAMLAVISTGLTYAFMRGILCFISGGCWLMLGFYSYTQSAATGDIYWGLGIFGVFVGAALMLEIGIPEEQTLLRKLYWRKQQESTGFSIDPNLVRFKEQMRQQREVLNYMRSDDQTPPPAARRPVYSTAREERKNTPKPPKTPFEKLLEKKYGIRK